MGPKEIYVIVERLDNGDEQLVGICLDLLIVKTHIDALMKFGAKSDKFYFKSVPVSRLLE